jgi:WD40 repeat protein
MSRWGGVRPSKVNTTAVLFGLALALVAVLGPRVNVDGTQVGPGAPGWQRAGVLAVGLLVIAWGVLAGRVPVRVLRAEQGFLGAAPPVTSRLVERPDQSAAIVRALRARQRSVAVAGIVGAGKSTLAARACSDRRVRRRFRDGVTWLDAGQGKDPVVLLAELASRLDPDGAALGFTTVGQGRDKLTAQLRGKRVLVAVDNVLDRGPVDALTGLASKCTVLFTTRVAELATTAGAVPIWVDRLTADQALELLGRWAGQAPAALPNAARTLCVRMGNLALGVAMAGAMVAQGRQFADVLGLIEQDLARVRADLDPAYPYRTLSAAIEAGITSLPEASQGRYAQLAVFAGHGQFSRDAARALWAAQLADADAGELLAELAGRSLLAVDGEGWFSAHDLQYAILARRLGVARLSSAHADLVEGYRTRYPGGWAHSAGDPYLSRALASHLHDAGQDGELRELLTDPEWIEARLTRGQLPGLIRDYDHASDLLSREIVRALRRSAPILAADPAQIRGQLAGRLLGHSDNSVAAWVSELTRSGSRGPGSWLVPLTAALTPTSDPLQQILTGHAGWVAAVAISADGSRAVSGGTDGSVRVWDLAIGREQANLAGHVGEVRTVTITPDGARVVSVGRDGLIRIWDLSAGQVRASLAGRTTSALAVAVTPDGARAVTGGYNMSIETWDLSVGRVLSKLTDHIRPVLATSVTADGTQAVSAAQDGSIRIWDLASSSVKTRLAGHGGEVFSVAVTPDASRAVSGGEDGSVRVWDLAAGKIQATLAGHTGRVLSVAVTPDGTTAVSGGEDGSVRVWDLAAGKALATLNGHGGGVQSVAINANGTTAVSGSRDGSVRLWDLATDGRQAQFADHANDVWSVAAAPDGTSVVSGGEDGSVRVWDLAVGKVQATLTGHIGRALSVAVTVDGNRAVSGGEDGSIHIWDLAVRRLDGTLNGHDGSVLSVAVTADGTRAVSGGKDGTVRVWDLTADREIVKLPGHEGWVWSVAPTADGNRAVSSGEDGTVRLWDLSAGKVQATLSGHAGRVLSVALTADGATAVSGGEDGSVCVWDTAAHSAILTLPGHTGPVWSVAVTPDGTRAVSGSEDSSIQVWDLAAGTAIARWDADYPIVACDLLPSQPLKIAVGQRQGAPYLLELRIRDDP